MGHKRFHEELSQETSDGLNFLLFAGSSCNPCFGLRPGLVQSEKPALASSLDQLIWFGHELQAGLQEPRERGLCLV